MQFLAFLCAAATLQGAGIKLAASASPLAAPLSGAGDSFHPILTPDGRFILFASTANNLAATTNGGEFSSYVLPKMNVFLRDRQSGTTTLVSVNAAGTAGGNDDSTPRGISTNGQFALFESDATDLAAGDTNGASDVFVRDTVNNVTMLVSVNTNGIPGNGPSYSSVMTPDGRYVAFTSVAGDLVPNDTNGIADIFVRDLQSGSTVIASPGTSSTVPNQNAVVTSDLPSITPDGRYVSFITVTNNWLDFFHPQFSWFTVGGAHVRDMIAGTTTDVCTNMQDLIGIDPFVHGNAISEDGQFVVLAATFKTSKVYSASSLLRCNLQTGTTDIITRNGSPPLGYWNYAVFPVNPAAHPVDTDVQIFDVSSDGRFVAYLGQLDTNSQASSIYQWDGQDGLTTLVSGGTNGIQANSTCGFETMDSSGRYVAFSSTATNLVTNAIAGEVHLYLWDAQSGMAQLLDVNTNGTASDSSQSGLSQPTTSGLLAFDSTAEDLVDGDGNRASDVFVRDTTNGTTELISMRQPGFTSQTPLGTGLNSAYSVSSDGRFVAIATRQTGLTANGTKSKRQIYVCDVLNGTNALASIDVTGLTGGDGDSSKPSLSADGRYVAFSSSADNLVMGNDNGATNVFVRDVQAGTTTLVSINKTGTGPGSGRSYSPIISSDGQKVLFFSDAKDLTSGTFTSISNLFWRDLKAGITYALTTNGCLAAAITPNSRFAVFCASPMDSGDIISGKTRIWDSQTAAVVYSVTGSGPFVACSPDTNRLAFYLNGVITMADRSANGAPVGIANVGLPFLPNKLSVCFSGDGRFLLYTTLAERVSNDRNFAPDVYLYDCVGGTNLLVSQGTNGLAVGTSDSPAISADGRFIAYRSFATNLLANSTNGGSHVYLYDCLTGSTTLLGTSIFTGGGANSEALAPQFSGDGQTLFFQSWASDLVASDFNQDRDLFSLRLYTADPTGTFVGQIVFSPGGGQGPTLTWPAAAGKTYVLQYKKNVTDPFWQNLNATVTVNGNQASATDPTADPGQRFYRVIAF